MAGRPRKHRSQWGEGNNKGSRTRKKIHHFVTNIYNYTSSGHGGRQGSICNRVFVREHGRSAHVTWTMAERGSEVQENSSNIGWDGCPSIMWIKQKKKKTFHTQLCGIKQSRAFLCWWFKNTRRREQINRTLKGKYRVKDRELTQSCLSCADEWRNKRKNFYKK